MSGGNCPETPRQKMIGMMYLFLTAMLAINVSSTVLTGFTLVDESLRSNNEIFLENNTEMYSKIKFEYDKNPIKFGEAYNKSVEIQKQANEIYTLIDSAKWKLVRVCDGPEGNPFDIKAKDNVDAGFEALVFKLPGAKKTTPAEQIKEGLNAYKQYLIDEVVVDTTRFSALTHSIIKSLSTADPVVEKVHGEKKDPHAEAGMKWEDQMFTGIPVGAVMALMSKMQTDIRNTEALALTHLKSQVTAGDFKVNKIDAYLIPKSTNVVRGGKFIAQSLLAAIDTTQKPSYEVRINGSLVQPQNETGYYEVPCNTVGEYEVTGNIITKNEDGSPNRLAFAPMKYEVSEPSATVSATKMNVLYAGVENPMSISVPGFSSRSLKVSFDDGSPLVANGKLYIASPKEADKVINVVVQAQVDGKYELIGKTPFRVKRLPSPTAFIKYPKTVKDATGNDKIINANFNSGRIKKRDLLKAIGVVAELQDSDFEVNYKVLSFDITFYDTMGNAKTFTSKGPKFTKEQVNRIKGLGAGEQFFISNVRALGPDGVALRLLPIDITLS